MILLEVIKHGMEISLTRIEIQDSISYDNPIHQIPLDCWKCICANSPESYFALRTTSYGLWSVAGPVPKYVDIRCSEKLAIPEILKSDPLRESRLKALNNFIEKVRLCHRECSRHNKKVDKVIGFILDQLPNIKYFKTNGCCDARYHLGKPSTFPFWNSKKGPEPGISKRCIGGEVSFEGLVYLNLEGLEGGILNIEKIRCSTLKTFKFTWYQGIDLKNLLIPQSTKIGIGMHMFPPDRIKFIKEYSLRLAHSLKLYEDSYDPYDLSKFRCTKIDCRNITNNLIVFPKTVKKLICNPSVISEIPEGVEKLKVYVREHHDPEMNDDDPSKIKDLPKSLKHLRVCIRSFENFERVVDGRAWQCFETHKYNFDITEFTDLQSQILKKFRDHSLEETCEIRRID